MILRQFPALLLLLILTPATPASAANTPLLNEYLQQLDRLDNALTMYPHCATDLEEVRPLCEEVVDGFCKNLWSTEARGNVQVHDGYFLAGKSKQSDEDVAVLENQRALIGSLERLPTDLRDRVSKSFDAWKAHLAAEEDSKAWDEKLAKYEQDFWDEVSEVVTARWEKRNPEAAKKRDRDLTAAEKVEWTKIKGELEDQILEAKYAKHPNWQRVERVFGEVQADIRAAVLELKISDDLKKTLLEKVKTVKLSLPYSSERLGADRACGSTTVNAFYSFAPHSFTICAGFFNGAPSDSALYGVIAHEIGHSIDPTGLSLHDCSQHGELHLATRKLDGAAGAPFDCADWKKIAARAAEGGLKNLNRHESREFEKLYSCLASRDDLDPFTEESVRKAAIRITRKEISDGAAKDAFVKLGKKTFEKYGEVKVNESFLRADLLYQNRFWKEKRLGQFHGVELEEIFAQSLACQSVDIDGKPVSYADAPEALHPPMFEKAIAETAIVQKGLNEEYLTFCGKNCYSLTGDGLSVPAGENFADWVATQAGKHKLKRLPNRETRAESAALFFGLFCDEPGIAASAKELSALQKKYSLQVHPDGRIRRLSVFSPANAELAGCRVGKNSKGYGSCEP